MSGPWDDYKAAAAVSSGAQRSDAAPEEEAGPWVEYQKIEPAAPQLPYPERVGRAVSTFAREVVNPTVGPYATAAAAGAALGAPFGGIGALPGAAAGVTALTLGDIGVGGVVNPVRAAFGAEPVRTPSQMIREMYGTNVMGEPSTPFTSVLRTIGEFAVPAQAQARASNELLNLVSPGMSTTRNVLADVGRAPGEQTLAAIGAGGGVEAARAVGGESPFIETGAALLGGAAGQIGFRTTGALGRAGYNIFEPAMPRGPEQIRARAYMDAFGNDPSKVQQAIDMLESGMTPEQVALQTNNSGLAALVGTARYANTTVRDLYAARAIATNRQMADELLQAQVDLADAQEQQLARQKELGAAVPTTSQLQTGRTITRERGRLIRERQRTVVGPAYDAAFEAAADPFSFEAVVLRARSLQDDALTRMDPSLAPKTSKLLQQYKIEPATTTGGPLMLGTPAKPPMLTLRDADSVRKAITMDLSKFMGVNDPAARATRANLTALRDAIDESIRIGVPPAARRQYEAALDIYQREIARPFREGWVAKLDKKGRGGEAPIAPGDVTMAALNDQDSALRFVAAFKDDRQAMNALRQGILGVYRRAAVRGGQVNGKAHANFMEKYRAQLGILDRAGMNVRPQLEQFGARAMGLGERATVLKDIAAAAREAQVNLKDVTPEVSADRLVAQTRELPELKAVLDEINLSFRDRQRFESLAREGQLAGGGVKNIIKEEGAEAPPFLDARATLTNFFLSRLKGKLDVKTAAQVATDLINSSSAADALSQAMTTRRGRFGEFLFAPTERATILGPQAAIRLVPGLIGTNALAPVPPRENALAE
jgi:hypothetical protein